MVCDLIQLGVNPSKLFIVGHSLGAHIAGAAGRLVYRKTGHKIAQIDGEFVY